MRPDIKKINQHLNEIKGLLIAGFDEYDPEFIIPSHAEITKQALKINGSGDTDEELLKHKAYVDGALWMHQQCLDFLKEYSILKKRTSYGSL